MIQAPAAPCVPTAGSDIELQMHQYQFTLGYTYKFDTEAAPTKIVHK